MLSNLASIPLDSFLFVFIAFYGTMPLVALFQIMLGQILFKLIVATISIPLTYIAS